MDVKKTVKNTNLNEEKKMSHHGLNLAYHATKSSGYHNYSLRIGHIRTTRVFSIVREKPNTSVKHGTND